MDPGTGKWYYPCVFDVVELQLAPLWKVLLDGNKELFVNDKFLSSASDSGTCYRLQIVLVLLCQVIIGAL